MPPARPRVGPLPEGEPGTALLSVAIDPAHDDVVWMWQEFDDRSALRAHFEHDVFRALQLELGDLLLHPPAVRPLTPVARHVSPGVAAE